MPLQPNTPIVNAPNLYVNGLVLGNNPDSPLFQLILSAGAARDSTNVNDIILNENVVINGATFGVLNTLDVGALAANTVYAIFLIGDSTGYSPTGAMLTLATNSAPRMPLGYDMYRRVGWASTKGDFSFWLFKQVGLNNERLYYIHDDADSSFGFAGTGNATVYTPVQLNQGGGTIGVPTGSVILPPQNGTVLLYIEAALQVNNFLRINDYSLAVQLSDDGGNYAMRGTIGNTVTLTEQTWLPYSLDTADDFGPSVLYKVQDPGDNVRLVIKGFSDSL